MSSFGRSVRKWCRAISIRATTVASGKMTGLSAALRSHPRGWLARLLARRGRVRMPRRAGEADSVPGEVRPTEQAAHLRAARRQRRGAGGSLLRVHGGGPTLTLTLTLARTRTRTRTRAVTLTRWGPCRSHWRASPRGRPAGRGASALAAVSPWPSRTAPLPARRGPQARCSRWTTTRGGSGEHAKPNRPQPSPSP